MEAGHLMSDPTHLRFENNGVRGGLWVIPGVEGRSLLLQETELKQVGAHGRMMADCQLGCFAYYRSNSIYRVMLSYSIQAYGQPERAVLYANYWSDKNIQGGVLLLQRLRGGSSGDLDNVDIPRKFMGEITINTALVTVPSRLTPTGAKYMQAFSLNDDVSRTLTIPRVMGKPVRSWLMASGDGMEEPLREFDIDEDL